VRRKRGPVSEGFHAQFQAFLNDAWSKRQQVGCEQVADLEERERLKSLASVYKAGCSGIRSLTGAGLIDGLGKLVSLSGNRSSTLLAARLWFRPCAAPRCGPRICVLRCVVTRALAIHCSSRCGRKGNVPRQLRVRRLIIPLVTFLSHQSL
jgi:hypothetical protein